MTAVAFYLLRDRDAIFGSDFREHIRDMGIHFCLHHVRLGTELT